MKILLAYYHFEVCGGRYYLDAFRRLGHDVRHIGAQMSVKDAWGLTEPISEKYAHKPDGSTTDHLSFLERWQDWTPDLILVCDSMLANTHYRHPFYNKVPHAVIGIDNHVRDYESDWAHQFLAHYHGPAYPVDPTRKDHTWLPCATDTKVFTPSPIAWADREYDIAMVGVMYPRRVEVINALKDAGFKVFAATGLLYDEYRAVYHNSRISLCVSAAGDVAQRIYETGGMGCAILTDPLLDFGDEMTNKALHLFGRATYTNPQEAVSLARELLGYEPQPFQVLNTVQPIESGSLGEQAAREIQRNCLPHTWEARAQVIVNWFEREYGKAESVIEVKGITAAEASQALKEFVASGKSGLITGLTPSEELAKTGLYMERKPFLNLGCGRILLPGERPAHHALAPEAMYQDEKWVNIDRAGTVGADKVFDLFRYPWPLDDNSYDGALLSHLCEHIPHEIRITTEFPPLRAVADNLLKLQDGWFAFFAELYRVLTPGAEVHILSPHARSDGAISDPTHTRYLLPDSFSHSMQPNPDAPFEYATGGIHFETVATLYGVTPDYMHMTPLAGDPPHIQQAKHAQLEHIARTQNNVIPEFYVRLRVVK